MPQAGESPSSRCAPDTWAHCGFSGRHNSFENDIKNIKTKNGNRFSPVDIRKSIISYVAPDVGHSEAGFIPDASSIQWKASYSDKSKRPRTIKSDNPQEFMDAAKILINTSLSLGVGFSTSVS